MRAGESALQSVQSRQATSLQKVASAATQSGVGLIEVMSALFILVFGALAVANMQASALSAVRFSASHFALNSVGSEILEHLKADPIEAGLGTYNTDFSQLVADSSVPPQKASVINSWKSQAAARLPSGAARVNCSASNCTVSLRWNERIGTGPLQQLYNLNFPLIGN